MVALVMDDAVAARCTAIADSLDIPEAFTIGGLARAAAAVTGHPFQLGDLPEWLGPDWSTLTLMRGEAGVPTVYFPAASPQWFGLSLVARELAVILLGHGSARVSPGVVARGPADAVPDYLASLVIARCEALLDTRPHSRADIAHVLPLWERVIVAVPGVAPWPESVRAAATSEVATTWRRQRVMTEIYAAQRYLTAYVGRPIRSEARSRLERAGIAPVLLEAATEWVCREAGLYLQAHGQPARPDSHWEPVMPGLTAAEALETLVTTERRLSAPAIRSLLRSIVTDLERSLLAAGHPSV